MFSSRSFVFASAVLALGLLAGCSSKEQKALDQAKQQAAATGQPQQVVSVDQNGTTTTTTVAPPAPGQKQQAIMTASVPAPAGQPKPAPKEPTVTSLGPSVQPQADQSQPVQAVNQAVQPAQGTPSGPAAPVSITVPAGTTLAIRIDQRISVKTSRAGDGFTGEVVRPVMASDGSDLVPKGARVRGVVDAAHRRGHFKGRSILALRLTALEINGREYPVRTADIQRSKKGKGKRSFGFIGGGTGLGMLIGGVASGGTGLLIGGLAGGGAGTAAAGLTGNRDIEIPAETVVQFRLARDLVVQAQ